MRKRQPAPHGPPFRTIALDAGTSPYYFAVTEISSPQHPKHSCLGIHLPRFAPHLHPSNGSCFYLLPWGIEHLIWTRVSIVLDWVVGFRVATCIDNRNPMSPALEY